MSDKNMIEEINVSNCKYFNKGWCLLSESCDAIRYKLCGDMTLFDCYYKQLKRKEQEFKTLASQLDLEVQKRKCLQQECEKLKKQLNQTMYLSEGTLRLYAKHKNIKYKKTVDEIEINILKYQELIFDKPRTMRENDCLDNILNIINKVKD